MLKQLDTESTGLSPYSIFLQAAQDNNISFDQKSLEYMIRNFCNKQGHLQYARVIKDMMIKTDTNQAGILTATWHLKQVMCPQSKLRQSNSSVASKQSTKPDSESAATASSIDKVPGEMEAA